MANDSRGELMDICSADFVYVIYLRKSPLFDCGIYIIRVI